MRHQTHEPSDYASWGAYCAHANEAGAAEEARERAEIAANENHHIEPATELWEPADYFADWERAELIERDAQDAARAHRQRIAGSQRTAAGRKEKP